MARRTIDELLAAARARLDRVQPAEALDAVRRGAVLVDIRSEVQRRADGVIPGAVFHPRNVLEWRADPTSGHCDPALAGDLGRRLILVCDEGYQSSLAAATLQDLGFTRATDLAGGFQAWLTAGLPAVRLVAWGTGDLALLHRLMGDAGMMEHLGGPETDEKIAERQARYEAPGSGMYKIIDVPTGQAAGSVGYWERAWRGERCYEAGWSVLGEFQGRGIAAAAAAEVIALARAERRHGVLHAFPSVENPASNAICRKLGFTLAGECEVEYPPGHAMRCNDWRLELDGQPGRPTAPS